jgi:hypothetical protein
MDQRPQTYIEIYELELGSRGPEGVVRRENVTGFTEQGIEDYARSFARRVDRDLYGVRTVHVTVEVLKEF